jgi:hypothetical protein
VAEAREKVSNFMAVKQTYRNRAEVTRFFTGMQIVDPGIVPVQEWRPVSAAEAALPAAIWGGVGRKI